MAILREWREGKGWSQADLAAKLGEPRPTYQKMESGSGPIDANQEARLRKMGFTGLLPRQEAKETPAPTITREEHARALGVLEGQIRSLERALENLAEAFRAHILQGPEQAHPKGRT